MSFLSDSDVAPKANIGQSRLVLMILHILIVNWPFCIFQSVSKHQMCFTSSEDKFLYLCTYIVYWCLQMSFCFLWIFSLRIFQKQGTTIRLCDKIQFIKLFKSTLIVDVLSSETIFIFKHLETMENSQKQFINNGNLQVGISTHDRRSRSHVLTKATVWPESHNIHMSQNLDLDSFWHLLHYFNSWQRKVHPDQGWQTHALL